MTTNDDWDSLLAQLNIGRGHTLYLKGRKNRIRLLLPRGRKPRDFFVPYQNVYQGKVSTKYLVWGLLLESSVPEAELSVSKVWAIRMPKTVIIGILTQLQEGFPLFDPREGPGINISRQDGARVTYTVSVTPKAIPIDVTQLEWPAGQAGDPLTLEELAELEAEKSRSSAERKGTTNLGDDDDTIPF